MQSVEDISYFTLKGVVQYWSAKWACHVVTGCVYIAVLINLLMGWPY